MAAPSAQTIQRIASETGHQAGTIETVLRLLDLMQEIALDEVLAPRLVLKGGTALNMFHLGLDRLSVDIDLNYVGALDRAAMEAERPALEAALNRLLTAQGYAVRRQPDEHAGGKWLARYASALGGKGATLEVDVNYMARQPLFGATAMNSIDFGGARALDVRVLDLHEIAAGKLVALIDRRAARDPFDTRRILAVEGLDWAAIKAAVLAFGASGRRDWRLASIDDIGADSAEASPEAGDPPSAGPFQRTGRHRGLDRGSGRSLASVWPSCSISRRRSAVSLDGVLDRGEIRTDDLTADAGLAERIAAMPMLAWKARNVRLHRGGPA